MKKLITMVFAGGMALCVGAGDVTAMSVTAQQRYPWNGMVDITVMLSGASNDAAQAVCTFVATNDATHAALNVLHVTGDNVVTGSDSTWIRRFVWDATADVGEVKVADLEFTVETAFGGVQLWENGPYWAECNVGATRPEECGYYFWWGDTVGYGADTNNATWDGYFRNWNGVKWVSSEGGEMSSSPFRESSCPTCDITTSQLQSAGYIDSTGNLVAAHDAATAHLGAPWRMPTDAEFLALISNCTTTLGTCNGVWGLRVMGKGMYSAKSIFLPAAGFGGESSINDMSSHGFYWSSTRRLGYSRFAWMLSFYSYGIDDDWSGC